MVVNFGMKQCWLLILKTPPPWMPCLLYGARIVSILKHHYAKMKTVMTTGFAQTENERTVMGMAKYIDREGLIEWLKRIPLKDLSDGLGLCRVIFEDDFKKAIKNMPKGIIVDAVPVSELEKLRDYLYAEDLIFMRGLAELNKLIANYGAKKAR